MIKMGNTSRLISFVLSNRMPSFENLVIKVSSKSSFTTQYTLLVFERHSQDNKVSKLGAHKMTFRSTEIYLIVHFSGVI
jgi:hypothetical protein